MICRLGYVAICKSIDAPTNRTCRLRNATPEHLRELIASNLENLRRVLAFNGEHAIRLYRISSDLIPFGSHPVNRLRWWEEFRRPLAELGRYCRAQRMRLSMHPGQFTLLNARDTKIVVAAIADLGWHCRLLDALGMGPDAKVIVHLGGTYGDSKQLAIERFCRVARTLPRAIGRRLVIENDERIFTAEDVLRASELSGLPVVFDWLHHRANPGRARRHEAARVVVQRCFDTWRRSDGIPKVHISSQAERRRRGAHAAWLKTRDVLAFLRLAPDLPFDCMLEAKAKELALFRLRQNLARWGLREACLEAAARNDTTTERGAAEARRAPRVARVLRGSPAAARDSAGVRLVRSGFQGR